MPKYKYQLSNGKSLTLEGDTQPSDAEVEAIAKEQGLTLAVAGIPDKSESVDLGEHLVEPSKRPDAKFTGSPKFNPTASWDIPPVEHEPDTYLGGFIKGLKDYGREITSGIMPALESAANPQTEGDILNLLIPNAVNFGINRFGGNLENIGKAAVSSKPASQIPSTAGIAEKIQLPPEMVAVGDERLFNVERRAASRVDPVEQIASDIAAKQGSAIRSLDEVDIADQIKRLESTNHPAAQKEASRLRKMAGRSGEPFDPNSLQGLEKSKARQAAMDARNEGFRGTVADDAIDTIDDLSSKPASNKPKFRLDTESGAFVPIDETGNQVGMAVGPAGETVRPELAKLSKFNQTAKFANESQKKSLWGEIRDANRALLTSFDFSAAGRQGKPLMMTKAYWGAFDDMFKSWGSERAYNNVIESIESMPEFTRPKNAITGKEMPSLAERAGLDIRGKEEMFQSNIAEKYIPGVKMSERAYNAFLGKLRADHFSTMVRDAREMGLNPDKNDVVLKQIASFINDATGRGSLGKLEKAAPILNETFFAPRLMASRVNMYKRWLNPKTYDNTNPVLRKQALKSLLSTMGFGLAVGELARLGGAQVNNDPTSADFRKIKIGNTRIDPFSGFQQYAVGASRLLSGKTTSTSPRNYGRTSDLTSGKFGQPSRASVASQFFQNKLAPIPSFVWSWMEGKDWSGEPFELKKALLDRTVPIIMQDLYELQQEDPNLLPLGVLPLMGEGLQTYAR